MVRAIARLQGASEAHKAVSGTVVFEQSATDPLGDVTVRIDASGLQAGQHGFHIHQFGDVRTTEDLSTIGYHFVPFCVPPERVIDDATGQVLNTTGSCADDQVHGLPPSVRRQPGDMGNVDVGAGGKPAGGTAVLVIGQGKMSLTDKLRSIVGRTVIIHQGEDDGSQPFGNAGGPEAFGVIGLASSTSSSPIAKAPEIPHITKIMCAFQPPPSSASTSDAPSGTPAVVGSTLLTLLEPTRPNTVRLQARIAGLTEGSTHSFHFHEFGDMTVDINSGELGEIYTDEGIQIDTISFRGNVGMLDLEFESFSLQRHVGRSITIHQGSSKDSPTIAAAVCGIAHPKATLETSASHHSAPALSPGVIAVVVISALLGSAFLCVSVLFYLGYPIPVIGGFLSDRKLQFTSVPPPPPPPVSSLPRVEAV